MYEETLLVAVYTHRILMENNLAMWERIYLMLCICIAAFYNGKNWKQPKYSIKGHLTIKCAAHLKM